MLTHNVNEATVIASIPVFLIGVDVSFAANLKNLIQNRSLTLIESSIVGSINLYARVLGAVAAGCIVDRIGRKNSILISLFLSTTAWIIISYFSSSVEIVYVGRICSGLACGIRAVVILYISEVVHQSRRGKLLAFCSLSASFGIGFTYLVQYFFVPNLVSIFALIISLFGLIQAFFLYETKYWLLMKNRSEEAQRSMLWFDDTMTLEDALDEIEEIQSQQDKVKQEKNSRTTYIFERWSFVKRLIICLLIYSCRTFSGRMPISVHPRNYYKLFILPVTAEIATLIQGILEIVFSLANLFVADSFPRKRMLQTVCWTMITCLIVSYFQVTLVKILGIVGECINFLSLMLYIGLACGFLLSLTMITVTEIASTITEVRGIIMSTCQIWHSIISAIYTSSFPFILESIPVNYILFFMLLSLIILSLLVTLVPETVGKALHKCDWVEKEKQEERLLSETDEENLLIK